MFLSAILSAQIEGGFSVEPDTIEEIPDEMPEGEKPRLFAGKPGKAALYSFILPGAGQIYNKRYWKAPIVWGAVGGVGAIVIWNTNQYKDFKEAYRRSLLGLPQLDPRYESQSADVLRAFRDQANRNRQLSIIILSLTWIAQSAEAYVDAHLRDFDISEDLTFRLKPIITDDQNMSLRSGIVISF